jgi:hypothetical protein
MPFTTPASLNKQRSYIPRQIKTINPIASITKRLFAV